MLVPPQTHELAMREGFRINQLGRPQACCICDSPIPTFGWTYQLQQGPHMYDNWCTRCIEEKLPDMVAGGRALR